MGRDIQESGEERAELHRQTKRRHFTSVLVAMLMVAIMGLIAYTSARGAVEEARRVPEKADYQVQAQLVDETSHGKISGRMQEFIGQVEQDFREAGYIVSRVTLPVQTSREIWVDLEGRNGYIKMTMDRGAAVGVEDAVRVIKYLGDREVEYMDVRLEGKAYFK
jgi:hypothetical protein